MELDRVCDASVSMTANFSEALPAFSTRIFIYDCFEWRQTSSGLLDRATFAIDRLWGLFDHSTGDAVAGIAGWVGLPVVSFFMDDDSAATWMEH